MMRRGLTIGFVIWLAATVVLRFAGQYLLHPENLAAIVVLLAASFPLMGFVARRICLDVPREQWPVAGIGLVMPTLVLDSFSTVFFPLVYPNIPQQAAGLFGGWMLCCCAGALFGVSFARR